MVLTVASAETPSCQAHAGARSLALGGVPERPLLLARLQHLAGRMSLPALNHLFDAKTGRAGIPITLPPSKARGPSKNASTKLAPRPTPNPATRVARTVPMLTARQRRYNRQVTAFLRERKRIDRHDKKILKYARHFGLSPRLVKSIIAAESSFRLRVRSSKGAVGLMQLMPATAEEMGVSRSQLVFSEYNIRAGTAYLAHLFKRVIKQYRVKVSSYAQAPEWIVRRVLAAYNAGPRFLYRTRLYRATRRYVERVLHFTRSKLANLRGVLRAPSKIPTLYVRPAPIPEFQPVVSPPAPLKPSPRRFNTVHTPPALPY